MPGNERDMGAAACEGRASQAARILTIVVVLAGTTDAASVRISQKTTIVLPSGKYQHSDPGSKINLICDKCPAGTYVSKHCTESALRECSPCPNGTFTKHENGNDRCHLCRATCQSSHVEELPCTALSDRECTCPPATFLLNDTCTPHTPCPVGWGVRKKGSEVENVKCKACSRGTYSDVPSSVLKCKTHTDCAELGLALIKPGTTEHDNVCGALSSTTTDVYSTHTDYDPTDVYNETAKNETIYLNTTDAGDAGTRQNHTKKPAPVYILQSGGGKGDGLKTTVPRTMKRTPPRQNANGFDINEHLPWMIVLFLLLVLVIIVVCSVRKSSRTLKKGPKQDPSSIVEKAGFKKSNTLAQNREKWVYYCNGHGIDILKLVAAQIGGQWQDIYQFLCDANEHEVASFSNGYTADHERAYAALQHWTIQGPEASLAQLISALRQHRRNDVVEKIRGLMEDRVQMETDKLTLPMEVNQPMANGSAKPPDSNAVTVEPSPLDKNKGFFADESEPLLRCDSTSSGSSALSRTGSFITKGNGYDRLDRLFEIAGVKSQEASQKLLDSVYCHLPDLL
ncbi:hypothetical protein XELAEV_18030152mg [Xenopus laevis]|uniref:Tumor necrosis factor receptor superfamily member 21 n=1 Tax=Xenopus laevis TaxID=8355 RepID=A0A974CT56_XENLA|nr:hypothetical protein XELAEV_18030152mg [Xenopus laevis]